MQFGKTYRAIPSRAIVALAIFSAGVVSLESGVTLTGDVVGLTRSLPVNLYYSLSLFVVGGIEIGTPMLGPRWAVLLLWSVYFAAPVFAVSTLMDFFLRIFATDRWRLKRLKNHIIIEGDDELTRSYLRHLRSLDPRRPVVIVSSEGFPLTSQKQFQRHFNALTVEGEFVDEYTLEQVRIHKASKILMFSDHSLRNFEAVKTIIDRHPEMAERIVMHVDRLRFMRSVASTRLARTITVFNGYQSAAETLVKTVAAPHVNQHGRKVGVVIAGFGRFGQSILESLQTELGSQLNSVVLIEQDAERRLMVAQEQVPISSKFSLTALEGDITHPLVWRRVDSAWDTKRADTLFMLATDHEEHNLRTALWLRRLNRQALVFVRLKRASSFTDDVAEDHNIVAMSLSQLIERAIPDSWIC